MHEPFKLDLKTNIDIKNLKNTKNCEKSLKIHVL